MASPSVARSLVGLVLVAVVTVATYFVFLGRDTTMQLDPATGRESGPWSTAQVAGCLGTLLIVLMAAVVLRVPPLVAAAAMTVSFAAVWTVQAAADDETGLFMVGAVLVLIGMAVGTGAVSLLTAWVVKQAR
jgi:hypothetical protein